ncbi:DUF3551 domain-containing protein [Rhodopseudomonas palustris]|uniref:DUF3551 domain-containing protein n=1 Tax=Rhodopseudomonas palustris (strain BisB18) TaxID=316056 RepID=Q213T5_RHOPB
MHKIWIGLAALVAAAALGDPAQARDYRYCLISPGFGYPGECSYSTYRQCAASASGRYADCIVNPRAYAEPRRTYRRRHR